VLSDDPVRLSAVGQVVRRRWRVLAVFAVAGALLGAGASLLFSPGYTTSTSVLLQGQRDPDGLETESQVAMSSVVLGRAAAALGGISVPELRSAVVAKVADGNIITISGRADDPDRAQRIANVVAQEYVSFSTQLATDTGEASAQEFQDQRKALRQRIAETNDRITELHASAAQGPGGSSVQLDTELEALRTGLAQAVAKLEQADATAGQAKIVIMGAAERPEGPAAPTPLHFVAGGALLGFVLGVFGHLLAARADRRLRTDPEIAAALGAPVLGEVDVPEEPQEQAGQPVALRTRLRRLLWDERPWDVPQPQPSGDETSRQIRYQRVLARLPGGPDATRRVLVLVAADDALARRAAEQLTAAAAGGAAPGELRIVEIAAGRPTVPDDSAASGVLVVLGVRTRTGWELVGIAEACADAGHEVLGAVVAHRTRPPESGSAGARRSGARRSGASSARPGESAPAGAMAGSA
jgi:capsular polysaccharide biosynthesis protein